MLSLTIFYHVGLIDLLSSPIKLRLISCGMSEKTIFISEYRKVIICRIVGQKKMEFGGKHFRLLA